MSQLKEPVTQLNDFCPPDAENFNDDGKRSRSNNAIYNQLDRKYTKLCQVAKMDAWHDHHTISDLLKDDIDQFVLRHLPVKVNKGETTAFNCYKSSGSSSSGSSGSPGSAGGDGQPSSENIFIYRMFLKKTGVTDAGNQKLCKPSCDNNPDQDLLVEEHGNDIFNAMITQRYNIGHVKFKSNSDDKDDGGTASASCPPFDENQSKIEEFFYENAMTEDIHIIRDVAYGNWADDIAKWGKGKKSAGNNIITVQTAAGIFDPGPSTHCFTSAGKRQGFIDIESKSRYALFETYDGDNFHQDESVVFYPKVTDYDPDENSDEQEAEKSDDDLSDDEDGGQKDVTKTLVRNQLLYTRFDCTLYGKTSKLQEKDFYDKGEVIKFIDSANVNFIVSVPDSTDSTKNNIYITTKKTSNKAQSISELPVNDNIIKKEASKSGTYDERTIRQYGRDFVINKSGKLKIMTKKFGDHGQAVTACKSRLTYRLFEPVDPNANQFKITQKTSTGFHAFLSFDRVAVASAIYYGAPIVIFVNHDGAMIFTSKKFDQFKTATIKYQSIIQNINRKDKEYHDLKKKSEKLNITSENFANKKDEINQDLPKIIESIQFIYDYLINVIDLTDKNASSFDIVYQIFVSLILTIAPFIDIFTTHINISQIKDHTKPVQPVFIPVNNDEDQEAETKLKTVRDYLTLLDKEVSKVSGNISLYNITKDTQQKINAIATFCEESKRVPEPYKRINKLGISLKLNSITKKLISSFNPYVGSQKNTMRQKTNKLQGQVGCEIGMALIEEIYQHMNNYRFEFKLTPDQTPKTTDFKNIFSTILHNVFDKATPNAMPFFLTSMGRDLDGDNTKSLVIIDADRNNELESRIATFNSEITAIKDEITSISEEMKKAIENKSNEIKKAASKSKSKENKITKEEKIAIRKPFEKKIKNNNSIIANLEAQKSLIYQELALQENANMNFERSENLFLENTFSKSEIKPIEFETTMPENISDLEMVKEETSESEEINTDFECENPPPIITKFTSPEETTTTKPAIKRKKNVSVEAVRYSKRLAAKQEGGKLGGKRKKRTKNKRKNMKKKTQKKRRRTKRNRQKGGDGTTAISKPSGVRLTNPYTEEALETSIAKEQQQQIEIKTLLNDLVKLSQELPEKDIPELEKQTRSIMENRNMKEGLKDLQLLINTTQGKIETLKQEESSVIDTPQEQNCFEYLHKNIETLLNVIESDRSTNIYKIINNYKKANELLYINNVGLAMLACKLASYQPVETTQTGGGERHQFLTTANINNIHSLASINAKIQEKFETYVGKDLKTFVGIIKKSIEENPNDKKLKINKNPDNNNFTIYDQAITLNGVALLKHLLSKDKANPPTPEQLLNYKKEILTKYTAQKIEDIRTDKIFEPSKESTPNEIQEKLTDLNRKEAELDIDDDEYEVSSNIILQTILTDKTIYRTFMEFLCIQYNEFQEYEWLDTEEQAKKDKIKEFIEKNGSEMIELGKVQTSKIESILTGLEIKLPLQEIEVLTPEDVENANTIEAIDELLLSL